MLGPGSDGLLVQSAGTQVDSNEHDRNSQRQDERRRRFPLGASAKSLWFWLGVTTVLVIVVAANIYWAENRPSGVGGCEGLCGTVFGFGTASQEKPTSGTAGECAANNYCYEIALSEASGGMTPSDMQLKLTSNSGATIPIVSWYIDSVNVTVNRFLSNLTNPSGTWVSTPGTGGSAVEITGGTMLTGAMVIWIDVSATHSPYGTGAMLVAYVSGPHTSSVETTLP